MMTDNSTDKDATTTETGNELERAKRYAKPVKSEYESFVTYMRERAAIEGPLALEKLTTDQMANILAAKTEEELEEAMEFAGLIGLRDVPNGAVVQFNGFHLVPGTRDEFKNKLGIFAVLDATLLTKTERFGAIGTNVLLDTGVERIITMMRAVESGQIPGLSFPIQRIVVKQAAGRGDLITLKKLPPVVNGETVPS
jgi:hypothetical protein